jgi:hypothetical protein
MAYLSHRQNVTAQAKSMVKITLAYPQYRPTDWFQFRNIVETDESGSFFYTVIWDCAMPTHKVDKLPIAIFVKCLL